MDANREALLIEMAALVRAYRAYHEWRFSDASSVMPDDFERALAGAGVPVDVPSPDQGETSLREAGISHASDGVGLNNGLGDGSSFEPRVTRLLGDYLIRIEEASGTSRTSRGLGDKNRF